MNKKNNEEIKKVLGDFEKSLNGSIRKKNKILALVVSQDKFLWSRMPKGINAAYLSDLVIAAINNKKEFAAEFSKKFADCGNNEPMPIEMLFSFGRLVVVEVGPCAYFAVLFSLKADMDMVRPAMAKTAKELKRSACSFCEWDVNIKERNE